MLLGNVLNKALGLNAFTTLHNGWMIDLEAYKGRDIPHIENLDSMLPTLFVNYGALHDKHHPLIDRKKGVRKQLGSLDFHYFC